MFINHREHVTNVYKLNPQGNKKTGAGTKRFRVLTHLRGTNEIREHTVEQVK